MTFRKRLNSIKEHHPHHFIIPVEQWAGKAKTKRARRRRWRAVRSWSLERWQKADSADSKKKFYLLHQQAKKRIAWLNHQIKPKPAPSGTWPAHMEITELFVNDNGFRNHVHIASPNRDALIELAKIAASRYGVWEVREFPPFEPVDCVHVNGSWHYRDSSNPWYGPDCAHRGDGLAFDLDAADRETFAHEVKARYGADRSDF